MHPLVNAIIVTPICARSLSFRPLVLPAAATVGVRVAEGTRGRVDVGVDGVGVGGLGVGGEVKVWGEGVARRRDGEEGGGEEKGVGEESTGGVPCIVRGGENGGDEGWVGGLNGLLKFNYPFGEEG